MLQLHTANRLEELADALFQARGETRRSPFERLVVVCESRALAAWLKRRLSLEQGIACLVETPLPATWLWQTLRRLLELPPADDPLDREPITWRLLPLLHPERLRRAPAFARLADYLRDDDNGLKRWQLARRIADAFDRYQYHRPGLVRDWSAGREEHWQALLWRALAEQVETHRVALIDDFLERLREGRIERLPERADLFSIHQLPPLLMQAYAALSRRMELHLWLLSPTEHYWADLNTPREMALKRRDDPDNLQLWQQGNPLLTQWGRQVRGFQDLLLQEEIALQPASEHFQPPQRHSLLGHLQADIYDAVDTAPKRPTLLPDEGPLPSIQFHLCHGPLRECQVLHDTLLHCLQADETLQPEEILVMVPEIGRYAPYIQAVFGSVRDQTRLPFHLADVLHADEHPLIHAFLELLELPEWRFGRAQVLGLADLPQVRRRFGLEEADLAELADLFDQLRVYWGLDGGHRQALGLPALDDNSWRQAVQRVMAGLALGGQALYRAGDRVIAPAGGIGAQQAERAARFFDLLETLRHWAAQLGEEATPGEWSRRLGRMLDDLFADGGDDSDRLQRIREALAELARMEELEVGPVSRTVAKRFLEERAGSEQLHGRLYREGITFCAMRPLRGVPFRVIALLGLQESAFPRRGSHVEFDRMASRRQGDPDPAQEDRFLFLETLLAARERLILSYTGRNPRNNDPLEPSVVVRELMEYLDERYRFQGKEEIPISRALSRLHPLHPFSPRNFGAAEGEAKENRDSLLLKGLAGHDRRWFQAARAIAGHRPRAPQRGWPGEPLVDPAPADIAAAANEVTPGELARFLRDPVRHFVQQRLRLQAPEDPALAEEEPLSLDGLEKWKVRDLCLQLWQQGRTPEEARLEARARGLLPHGPWGERVLAEVESEIEAIAARCARHGIEPPLQWRSVDIDLQLESGGESWRIGGRVREVLAEGGAVLLSAGKYGMSRLLELWVQHLCLQAANLCRERPAHAFFQDRAAVIAPLDPGEAQQELAGLIRLYRQGQETPLPLPKTTFDRFTEAASKAGDEQALESAATAWWDDHHGADRDRFWNRVVLHGREWQPDEALVETARRLTDPLLARLRLEE